VSAKLVRFSPGAAVRFTEHRVAGIAACAQLLEKSHTLVGQHNMPRFARLGPAYGERAAIWVEVMHLEPRQFAKSGAGL
jgi:hypothetical protein